jgi:hypothetical protein
VTGCGWRGSGEVSDGSAGGGDDGPERLGAAEALECTEGLHCGGGRAGGRVLLL